MKIGYQREITQFVRTQHVPVTQQTQYKNHLYDGLLKNKHTPTTQYYKVK